MLRPSPNHGTQRLPNDDDDDEQECGICTSLPSLIVAMEPGKRHALRAHMPEAATDWLNPLSLGIMSASAYIENLA